MRISKMYRKRWGDPVCGQRRRHFASLIRFADGVGAAADDLAHDGSGLAGLRPACGPINRFSGADFTPAPTSPGLAWRTWTCCCLPVATPRRGKPAHRSQLMNADDVDIVGIYGAEYRGVSSSTTCSPATSGD